MLTLGVGWEPHQLVLLFCVILWTCLLLSIQRAGCGCSLLPHCSASPPSLSSPVFPAKRWNRHSVTGAQLAVRPGSHLERAFVRRSNTMPPNFGNAGLLGRLLEERGPGAGVCSAGGGSRWWEGQVLPPGLGHFVLRVGASHVLAQPSFSWVARWAAAGL